jgi:hypothetical protein
MGFWANGKQGFYALLRRQANRRHLEAAQPHGEEIPTISGTQQEGVPEGEGPELGGDREKPQEEQQAERGEGANDEPASALVEWRHRTLVELASKPLPPLPPWPCPVEESGRPRGKVAEALHAPQLRDKLLETEILTHDDMRCAAECTRQEHEAVLAMNEEEYDECVRKRDTG